MPGERVNDTNKKLKRKAKHSLDVNQRIVTAALANDLDENSMTYGIITRVVGNGRVRIKLAEQQRETTALIRKSLRSKRATGMGVGDVVIVGLPNWQREAADRAIGVNKEPEAYVEGLLDKAQASTLRDHGQIPEWMISAQTAGVNEIVEDGVGFEFDRSPMMVTQEEDSDDEDDEVEVASATRALLAPSASASAAAAATRTKWTRKEKNVSGEFNVEDI